MKSTRLIQRWKNIQATANRLHPEFSALLEVMLLFLPAIPAYLWLWPTVSGTTEWIAQMISYIYVFTGTLFIGLRRWSWDQLGINRRGLGLSLACSMVLLTARQLVIRSIEWGGQPPSYNPRIMLLQAIYYICIVGLVEELLFRGLVFRAFEEWRGARWAIWGSSFGFMLWHIFGQGLLIGAATFLIGLIFALFRWRTGGILGLILLHGLWDLQTVLLVSDSNAEILRWGRPGIPQPGLMILGFAMMAIVPIFLWKIQPLFFSVQNGQ